MGSFEILLNCFFAEVFDNSTGFEWEPWGSCVNLFAIGAHVVFSQIVYYGGFLIVNFINADWIGHQLFADWTFSKLCVLSVKW